MLAPDFIDVVQATVVDARAATMRLWGGNLELVAVAQWPGVSPEDTTEALLRALVQSPREGADVIVGWVARQRSPLANGAVQDASATRNGAVAVVWGDLQDPRPFLRPTLQTLARLHGAVLVGDNDNSLMSATYVPSAERVWMDPANRAIVLRAKLRPFGSEGDASGVSP